MSYLTLLRFVFELSFSSNDFITIPFPIQVVVSVLSDELVLKTTFNML